MNEKQEECLKRNHAGCGKDYLYTGKWVPADNQGNMQEKVLIKCACCGLTIGVTYEK